MEKGALHPAAYVGIARPLYADAQLHLAKPEIYSHYPFRRKKAGVHGFPP